MPFSVIIPALNEADNIGAAIASVRSQAPCQIIVVDGGSTDGTISAAAGADLVLQTDRGRALQMNSGAARAEHDLLLFLHADSTLAPGALSEAAELLHSPRVAAGCFRMHVPVPGLLYRLIEGAATVRVRWTGLAYGDQGLFLHRSVFQQTGGFPPLRLMEDLFFSRILHQLGQIVVARSLIHTSARRWQRVGLVRQTLRNWALTALAGVGVPPDQLARWYPLVR